MNLSQQIVLVSVFFIFSYDSAESFQPKVEQLKNSVSPEKPITILIQPFNDLPKEYLDFVSAELKKVYPNIKINPSIHQPKNTKNQAKTRYRADALIKYLRNQTPDGFKTIGLTKSDISTTMGKHADWGVIGLGFCPGKSSIVSSFRLKGANTKEKLFRSAVHELGHNFGLPHCPDKTCLMKDAKGKDIFNEVKVFCNNCKQILAKEGWML